MKETDSSFFSLIIISLPFCFRNNFHLAQLAVCRHLSADVICSLSSQFSLLRIDDVQKNISEHIFAPNGGYCAHYPSRIFSQRAPFWNWGISLIFLSFNWSVFMWPYRPIAHERKYLQDCKLGNFKSLSLFTLSRFTVFQGMSRTIQYIAIVEPLALALFVIQRKNAILKNVGLQYALYAKKWKSAMTSTAR